MSIVKAVIGKRPEKTMGENPLSDKETYLLKSLLYLLLYTGMAKDEDGEGLKFTSGPNPIFPTFPINMG